MAGSRLELIGTVFSRMNGLLRTGAIKYEDRPIWFDVYRAFPPKLEPHFDRQPVLPPGVPEEIPEIMYKEDIPRAAFFKKYGANPGGMARNLASERIEDASMQFVEKYNAIQTQHPDWAHSEIVETVSRDFNVGFASRERDREQGSSASQTDRDIDQEATENDPREGARRGTKRTIVTAETLLSMFKEAKLKSEQKKDDS